jgi:hypothetical protein
MPTARKPVTKAVPAPEPHGAVGFPGDDDYEPGTTDWEGADAFLAPVVPAAKFEDIGASITGIVVAAELGQQTDIDGGLRTFESGEVRQQLIVTVQTDEAEDDDDDGLRKIYVKSFMVKPFRNEMKRTKVKGVRPGGELTVTYIADGEVTKKGYTAPKLFNVAYEPPTK